MVHRNITAVILGGGDGNRLQWLTKERAKPSMPFAAVYRIIDLVLSNFYNSGIHNIKIITQYRPKSLEQHLLNWADGKLGRTELSQIKILKEGYKGKDKDTAWYDGTADAVFKNLEEIVGKHGDSQTDPDIIDIFSGDHIYYMDISQMNDFHVAKNADMTVAGLFLPYKKAIREFGVFKTDSDGKMVKMKEKPNEQEVLEYIYVPRSIVENISINRQEVDRLKTLNISEMGEMVLLETINATLHKELLETGLAFVYTSMGNYAFNRDSLINAMKPKKGKHPEKFDFGKHVIPMLLEEKKNVYVYNFHENLVPGLDKKQQGQWWDVGNFNEYFKVNHYVREIDPVFNLYNKAKWRLWGVNNTEPHKDNINRNLIAGGGIITGAVVQDCIIGEDVQIEIGSEVYWSIFFGRGTRIGKNVKIKNAIIDRDVVIPDGMRIGYSREEDKANGFEIVEFNESINGNYIEYIVGIPKGHKFSK